MNWIRVSQFIPGPEFNGKDIILSFIGQRKKLIKYNFQKWENDMFGLYEFIGPHGDKIQLCPILWAVV